MEFNIGEKVKIKGTSKIGKVLAILDNEEIVLEMEDFNVIKHQKQQLEEHIELPKVEKTNIIKRNTTSSVLEYQINNNEITFEVSNYPMVLQVALKILLHETELHNYTYERVSPFKLVKKYEDKHHRYIINFIDIRTDKKVEVELLSTDQGNRITSKHTIFIPDLLEICVLKNILKRDGNGYELVQSLDTAMDNCEYLKKKPSVIELEKEEYIIPKKYQMYA